MNYAPPVAGAMDVSKLDAIDVHTHVHVSVSGKINDEGPEAAIKDVFGTDKLASVESLANFYRDRNMACVAFMVDVVGVEPAVTNDELLTEAAKHADVMIPFASIDPHRADAVETAKRLIAEHPVRGFKFHPSFQAFFPDDKELCYPLYEVLAEHKLPALFHTGQTAVGSGQPGGGGLRLKYSNPMHLDDVAADFPDMPIVMAHPSVPWQDEALAIALHKPQVYIDLSGWSPKYFPPQLVQYANTLLRKKVLFGTDFPALTPERWLADFETLQMKDEVKPLILKENAARLFGLDGGE
jgi:predicted TIM-barrel fold metal-dependent hydrolase